MIKLFKMLNLKSLLDDKKILILSILSFILSFSLLGVITFFNENSKNYVKEYAKLLNHGDLAVHGYTGENENYLCNLEMEKYLNNHNFEYFVEEYTDIYIKARPYYYKDNKLDAKYYLTRFVDFKNINKLFNASITVQSNEAIISNIAAKQLDVTVGDSLYIYYKVLNVEFSPIEVRIGEIVDTNEINIENAIKGYIMLDSSYIHKVIQKDSDAFAHLLKILGYNDVPFDLVPNQFTGNKAFYIEATDDEIKEIIDFVNTNYLYEDNHSNQLWLMAKYYTKDEVLKDVNSYSDIVSIILILFCFFSMAISSLGLISLLNFRVIKRQKEIAILKVYGLNKKISIFLGVTEIFLIVFPAIILGTFLGFILFKYLGSELTGISPDHLTAYSIVISFLKLLFLGFAIILCNSIPVVSFVNNLKFMEVIRKQQLSFDTSSSTLSTIMLSVIVYITIFTLLFQSLITLHIAFAGAAIISIISAISLFACFLVKKIKIKSYLQICINNFSRDNSRFRSSIVSLATCLVIIFIVVTINFRLYDILTGTIFKREELQYFSSDSQFYEG